MRVTRLISSTFFAVLSAFSCPSEARETVLVGGYVFPPFVSEKDGELSGLTLDLIERFNAVQDEYTFEFYLSSPKRRYENFEKGKFDLVFFEDRTWGWGDHPVGATKPYDYGGEVFIALKQEGKDQSYFKDFRGKRIQAILGFHYAFAGFNADADYLSRNWDIRLTNTHDGNINALLLGRADIVIINDAFLRAFLEKNPEVVEKILIYGAYDQKYALSLLARPGGKIGVPELEALLGRVVRDGSFEKILNRNGFVMDPELKKTAGTRQ